MNPLDPTTPIPVTLEAQQWNLVINLLLDAPAPYRVTQALIPRMVEQIQAAAGQVVPQPNGNDDAHVAH